MDSLGLQAPDI